MELNNFTEEAGRALPRNALVESELKARFGVSYQNTYVQVGPDESRVQSLNGSGIDALNERPVF